MEPVERVLAIARDYTSYPTLQGLQGGGDRVGQDRTGQDRTDRVELYACRLATLYAVGSGNLYHDLDLSRCMPSYPDQRSKIQTKPGKVKIQVRMKPARCIPAPASTHKMQIQPSSQPDGGAGPANQTTRSMCSLEPSRQT